MAGVRREFRFKLVKLEMEELKLKVRLELVEHFKLYNTRQKDTYHIHTIYFPMANPGVPK